MIVTNEEPHANDSGKQQVTHKTHCNSGGFWCLANDSNYSVISKNKNELSYKLKEFYEILADYMTCNKIKLNHGKTHLLVMTTDANRRHCPMDVRDR